MKRIVGHRTRILVLFAFTSLSIRCQLVGPDLSDEPARFEGVKGSYQATDTIEARMVNTSSEELQVKAHCFYSGIDKLTESGWQPLSVAIPAGGAPCPTIYSHSLAAGDDIQIRITPTALLELVDTPAGTYRLSRYVKERGWVRWRTITSRVFKIQ